jgi:hypothetical protein
VYDGNIPNQQVHQSQIKQDYQSGGSWYNKQQQPYTPQQPYAPQQPYTPQQPYAPQQPYVPQKLTIMDNVAFQGK